MNYIWATHTPTQDFDIHQDAGCPDAARLCQQLPCSPAGEHATLLRDGETTGLCFPDPQGRTNTSGETIRHHFVVLEGHDVHVDSATVGKQLLWPLVNRTYHQIWEAQMECVSQSNLKTG